MGNIELRSEKVRNIIGNIPPTLIRYGISVITMIIVVLFAVTYFIPYTDTVSSTALANSSKDAEITIPYKYVSKIAPNMSVKVEFDGYNSNEYGFCNGNIIEVSPNPVIRNSIQYFIAIARITTSNYKIINGMRGKATITISDKSILKHLLNE